MASYGNAELIVIDNGSTDGSYEVLLNEYGRYARILQIKGITVAALRNRGAAMAEGEFLSFIDSDCIVGPDYFQQALAILRTRADATGAKYELPTSPHWIEKTWYNIHARSHDGFVNYLNGGNFLVKFQAFQAVNGFDETLIATEDSELCQRLNQSGFKVFEAHAVRSIHLGGDKSLGVFFRKTAWRTMGMFGMLKHSWISPPLFTSLAHMILCLGSILNLFVAPLPLAVRLVLSIGLFNFAPLSTVLYRGWQRKRLYAPLQAILLYHVYFLGRFYALYKLMFSRCLYRDSTIADKPTVDGGEHQEPEVSQLGTDDLFSGSSNFWDSAARTNTAPIITMKSAHLSPRLIQTVRQSGPFEHQETGSDNSDQIDKYFTKRA
jgi:GT2 family glycosyltransferase